MNNDKLIEYVREYKLLYDLNDKKYYDNLKKDAAWTDISIKLNVSEKECKKSWALLRDAFRRAIKKNKERKSGHSGGSNRKWKYEDRLSFLLPFMKEKSTICAVVATDDAADLLMTAVSTEDEIKEDEEKPPLEDPPPPKLVIRRRPKRARASSARSAQDTPCTALLNYVLKNKNKSDDIDQFFTSISTTVRTFPLKDRAIAKARVFELISQMEIEILNRPSVASSSLSYYSGDSS